MTCADGASEGPPGRARTAPDQVVIFDGEAGLKGQLLDVEIVDARNMTLFARRVRAAAVL